MATVLVKPNETRFGGMDSALHRSASVASASNSSHGPIGSKLLSKTGVGHDSKPSSGIANAFQFPISPPSHGSSMDRRSSKQQNASILMRRLPRNLTQEALRSMLLFAKDLVDVEFVPNEYDDDASFLTAVAHFTSVNAAKEARAMLDGKPNSTGKANMIVDIVPPSSTSSLGRRNTVDHGSARALSTSMSPSMAPLARQSSRFNGTFQSMDKSSPPENVSNSHKDLSSPDGTSNIPGFFSPQSPIANSINDRPRMTGKSVIDEDGDGETSEILKDPVAYLNNSASRGSSTRRPTNPQIPLSRFSSLSLSTNISSPSPNKFVSPRSAVNVNSPTAISPNHSMMAGSSTYSISAHQYPRHNYPPVNPADQNPPCNTLYVGNLPLDTSEDELKAMFSKQRGYKRLCFRTKQNGPMCFVEFEDVSFATKALNELYGATLHNSVKGGIRLSFSKNPLGVRSVQPGSSNPTLPLAPQSGLPAPNGLSQISGQNFISANGPPPGLSVPPGLGMPLNNMSISPAYNHPVNPMINHLGYSSNPPSSGGIRSATTPQNSQGTSPGSGLANAYPDYMLGR